MNAGSLPLLWRTGATARPLDGELVHAGTPLVPLRSRTEDDGSQTSVVVPHTLAWRAPELMGGAHAKSYRAFVKRAIKFADAVLAPTHAVAEQLGDIYGIEVQVLPLAAPTEYLENENSAALRNTLGLPGRYVVTTTLPGEHGRLSWLLDAMLADTELPDLVVLHLGEAPLPPVREQLAGRVHIVEVDDLAEIGAALSGAVLLALPQTDLGCGFEVLGALAARVPVLYADCTAAGELALDASVSAESEEEFAQALTRLSRESGAEELQRLRLFADDRTRSFSWRSTAWQLWELHASL